MGNQNLKNNVSIIVENMLCCGCGTCNVVCPKDAITMQYNNIGQLLPIIDDAKCVNCGLCYSHCPSYDSKGIQFDREQKDPYLGQILNIFVGKANNEKIFKNSQSGGLATAILTYLFDSHKIDAAIVCSVDYDINYSPKGIVVTNKEDLLKYQKSSYTQVDIVSAVKQLVSYQSVAIVGIPCHIQGIKALKAFKKEYNDKLKYTIGLICDRSLCNTVTDVLYGNHFKEQKKKIIWRDKSNEYKNAELYIENAHKERIKLPTWERFVLKEPFTAPRCRICYDKLNTHADITLGDPWGMSDIDWRNGESIAITRTDVGDSIIKEMEDQHYITLRKGDFDEFIIGQHIEERKKSVSNFLVAYNKLLWNTPTYSSAFIIDSEKTVQPQIDKLNSFVQISVLTKKSIIKINNQLLAKQKLKRSLHKIKTRIMERKSKKGLRILVNGTNTVNKGAELMFYAILRNIEKTNPEAEIIYNDLAYKGDNKEISYFDSNLKIVKPPFRTQPIIKFFKRFHVYGILSRLKIDLDNLITAYSNPDLFLDASGYFVSDKWNFTKKRVQNYEFFLKRLKANGTKIVFLPQAFGPLDKDNTKLLMNTIKKYADIIFARDQTSYNYITSMGIKSDKLKLYPDFTVIVDGKPNPKYQNLKDYVCIIPNERMIDKGGASENDYMNLLYSLILQCKAAKKNVYILNHEGKQDEILCRKLATKYNIPVVTGLNALEVKGFISKAYIVISSRFHGAVSSLNSCVPCLSTSWSHKYEELYKGYGQDNAILNPKDIEGCIHKLNYLLDSENNQQIRKVLKNQKEKHIQLTNEMWNLVWEQIK